MTSVSPSQFSVSQLGSRYKILLGESENTMEFKLFKLDIDELINDFAECESTSFAEFKKVWLLKKFSYIFESSPSIGRGVFMQTLYAHSIGYVGSADSLLKRLGGLYCLYCLYETQPFKPPFRIYMSHEELRRFVNLVREAKMIGVGVVSALLKSMLERNMFLFGATDVSEVFATEKVNEHGDEHKSHIQAFYEKLFKEKEHGSKLKQFIHMDLGEELKLNVLKKTSSQYAAAKELAINEASKVVEVQDIKHIGESTTLIGDAVEKTVACWNSQKELLYQQTGLQQEDNDDQDADDFDKALEDAFNILD